MAISCPLKVPFSRTFGVVKHFLSIKTTAKTTEKQTNPDTFPV